MQIRTRVSAAVAAAVMLLSACDMQAVAPDGKSLTGTWRYRATGFQKMATHPDIKCDMEVVIQVREEDGGWIEGVSEEANATCYGPDGRPQTDVEPTGVVRGEVKGANVEFSNAGGWHSFGKLKDGRVEGYLESYGGTEQDPYITARSGTFTLERISDQGYEGPRA